MVSTTLAQSDVRIALPFSDSNALSLAEELAGQLDDKSGGELEGQVFPNGTLGGPEDLFSGVSRGTIEVALLPTRRPFYTTGLSAPFTFSSVETAMPYFQSFERTETEFAITFAMIPTDVAVLVSQTPIVADDLSSFKILTRRSDLLNTYGAYQTTEISLAELLKTGVPQGNAAEAFLFRLGAPQRDIAVTRFDHRILVNVVLVGRDFYEALSDQNKQVLVDAVLQASSNSVSGFQSLIPQEFKRLRDLGWDIHDQTPVAYIFPDFTSGGDDCTADEYKKKFEDACKCETGDEDDEC
ncbi:hypothetical protein KUV47_00475 [Vannielia litorea]|uniref:TRAP transporter substrate-binding protein n=1 Tax=Vannielia litorea TaxID=1217970 RepID=UPI001C95F612|nr:hypothetical protein [Vannielia litorea]MBY6151671.1 hypothetical protein [Vannielia litorea]